MKYRGYLIQHNPYAMFSIIALSYEFYNPDDGNTPVGTGFSVHDCQEQIDEILINK